MTEPRDPNEPGWGSMPAGGEQPPQPPQGPGQPQQSPWGTPPQQPWGAPPGGSPPPGFGAPPPGYGPPPPGYGAPGYGQPPPGYGPGQYAQPYGYYAEPPTDGKAIGALVASILAWVFCPLIPAIVALVLASQSSKAIRESGGRLKGESMNTAARIISWINIVGSAILIAILIGAIASSAPTYEELGDFETAPLQVEVVR